MSCYISKYGLNISKADGYLAAWDAYADQNKEIIVQDARYSLDDEEHSPLAFISKKIMRQKGMPLEFTFNKIIAELMTIHPRVIFSYYIKNS